MQNWSPKSWQQCQVSQQVLYPDANELEMVLADLRLLPPLVSVEEVETLKRKLADAALGKAFVLQGGDCAELFSDCNADSIFSKLKILLQMSLVLVHGINKPVIKVGRLAGQYAKPRSAQTETINGTTLPTYRGDLVNAADFSVESRTPSPKRLLKGYSYASLTINYIRTLLENKFSDFSNLENWDLDFISHSPYANEYHEIIKAIQHSISLLDNLTQTHAAPSVKDKIFTCHEALHLQYEQALTRQIDDNWYNLSTHLPWIGMRTAQPGSAHLEYMRGIANPVAVKVGPSVTGEQLLKVCEMLDPDNIPGRLTLITRFGHENIEELLPPL
ncbi:MAG: 3-deoxy-7-phosphoheptulonate synthase, partial [Gammaproteobacteria bacterium]|nr:3-deoxy-7-phosphoheptulonate synthase [Gammaproteobacteria bacterium]